MLSHTFVHIPGIGLKTEQRFWGSGILCWDDFSGNPQQRISRTSRDRIVDCLQESKRQLALKNPRYFSDLLPAGGLWRLFPEFRDSTAYLDIETTGLDEMGNQITTIALYDGKSIRCYVNGRNLDRFLDDIKAYDVIVTYNGKSFDAPFIEAYFDIGLDQAHIDLRWVLRSLGYTGGLKACETRLGIDRGVLAGMDGFFAVLLWHDFQRSGNEKALETLLAYNIQDVLSLEALMVIAYNLKIQTLPFQVESIPAPVLPEAPFKPDRATVSRIINEYRYAPVFSPPF